MISRRSFIKLSGLAAVSLGSGLTVGKFISQSEKSQKDALGTKGLLLCGFLPDDKESVVKVLKTFIDSTVREEAFSISINGANSYGSFLNDWIKSDNGYNISSSANKQIAVRISKLNSSTPSDILVKESGAMIYSPETDFTQRFSNVRNYLLGKNGEYLFQAEVKESSFFDLLKSENEYIAVIENEKGIVDKISLNRKNTSITVDGVQGKTIFNIGDGTAQVHSSSCKHRLCLDTGIANRNGDFIACAPNKVILRIEKA